jgi:hypothetical protein
MPTLEEVTHPSLSIVCILALRDLQLRNVVTLVLPVSAWDRKNDMGYGKRFQSHLFSVVAQLVFEDTTKGI